jgi:hypothetical protein
MMFYYRAMIGLRFLRPHGLHRPADAVRSWLMHWRATDFDFRYRFWLT